MINAFISKLKEEEETTQKSLKYFSFFFNVDLMSRNITVVMFYFRKINLKNYDLCSNKLASIYTYSFFLIKFNLFFFLKQTWL